MNTDGKKRECSLKRGLGREYYCAVELALRVIGGKWKPIIVWRLGSQGVLRFGELRRQMPNVTQKMLTQQLRELEADGVVSRRAFAQVPARVDYALTDLGKSVMPILEQLGAWGRQLEDNEREMGAPRAAAGA